MADEKLLQVNNVVKKFGGLVALDKVSLELSQGEVLGLIGPNGAGKTTLFNAIAGFFRVNSGDIIFEGKKITHLKAHQRCHLGIARTFQITKPFESSTVLQNIMVGAYYGNASAAKSLAQCADEAEAIMEFIGIAHKRDVMAGTLNVSERKKLELSRALSIKPKLLLLDEVIGGLNPSEVLDMMELIKKVNRSGVTILMIEHVMRAVMGVSNRIMVLNFGKLLAEGTPEEVTKNEEVIAAYLGGGTENSDADY